MKTSAARDLTVKIDQGGLTPNTRYWFRFKKDADVSDVGTFKTAPAANQSSDVDFTWSGDSDGHQGRTASTRSTTGRRCRRAQGENADFFIFLGDTIYSDSGNRPGGPAITLADYRSDYRVQRSYPALTNLQKSTSTYPLMDDHEILNDFAGQTVDPARYAAGRQAFMENNPIRETGFPHDPSCAGDPLYRKVKWGSEVELFITDQRSCRSDDVAAVCGGDLGPTFPPAVRAVVPVQPVPDAEPAARMHGGDLRPQPHHAGAGAEAEAQERPLELDCDAQDHRQRARLAAVVGTPV